MAIAQELVALAMANVMMTVMDVQVIVLENVSLQEKTRLQQVVHVPHVVEDVKIIAPISVLENALMNALEGALLLQKLNVKKKE